MQTANFNDYGQYAEKIKNLVRDSYNALNEKDSRKGQELALQLVVESKMFLNSIRLSE